MSLTFRCAGCKRVLETDTPDSEALAEMEHYFGEVPKDELIVRVCDDCFNKMHPATHPEEVKKVKEEWKKTR